VYSADYCLPGETEEEEEMGLSPRSTVPPSRMSRTVSFDGDDSQGAERSVPASSGKQGTLRGSQASTAEMSVVHTYGNRGGGVITHVQSYGDQAAHRGQNSTQNFTRRPLYAGAHGRLGKNAADDELAPLPMPGTEQTGWKPIDDKGDKGKGPVRGTNDGGIRPAFFTQVTSSQYRDSSAKEAKGSITKMGETKRTQKASGAAYKVPVEKLGLSMSRTLPTVKTRTKEEREERRRKSGHSVLDPIQHPKSPDWGSVSLMRSSLRTGRGEGAGRAVSVDQEHSNHASHPRHTAATEQTRIPAAQAKAAHAQGQAVSEKFTQLELWVEEKIRLVLGQSVTAGADAGQADRPGSVGAESGDRQLGSSQGGRQMYSSSAVPQRLESVASSAAPHAVGSKESIPSKEDGSIGKLLARLKTTMATDEALKEPADKRKGRPPALIPSVEPMSGMRSEDPRVRAADEAKSRAIQTGAEVQQSHDDFEIKGEDKSDAWSLSADAKTGVASLASSTPHTRSMLSHRRRPNASVLRLTMMRSQAMTRSALRLASLSSRLRQIGPTQAHHPSWGTSRGPLLLWTHTTMLPIECKPTRTTLRRMQATLLILSK